ncbi:MAG: polymer-forming cytoskeletal protein [Chloroflexi bacterium]|nr:polymer-forming cytoskeletal protein [Chloroflexota bacterium]
MMNPRNKWILFLAIVLLSMSPFAVAHAQGPVSGDKLILGGRFTLKSGEIVRGDVIIFGGAADLKTDSMVTGDVAVIGGTAEVNGLIQGDVSVVGGSLTLGPHAVVEGNVLEIGGQFLRDPQATIRGDIVRGLEFGQRNIDGINIPLPENMPVPVPEISSAQPNLARSAGQVLFHLLMQGLSAVAWAVIMAAFGILLVILLPTQGQRLRQTATNRPLLAFVVGALTMLLLLPVFAVLMITVCLAPLAFALGLLVFAAMLMGWLAIGWELGTRILRALNIENAPAMTEALIGIVLLTLLWRLPLVVPLLGTLASWGIGIVVGSLGLGAVILGKFGSQVYPTPARPMSLTPLVPLPEEQEK